MLLLTDKVKYGTTRAFVVDSRWSLFCNGLGGSLMDSYHILSVNSAYEYIREIAYCTQTIA